MTSLYKNLGKVGGVIAFLASVLAISTPAQALSTYASGFTNPKGIAFDSSGNLFVANNTTTISKVAPSGTVSTFASLVDPQGLAFDSAGNLFAAEAGNNKIVGFDSSGNVIRTIASNATTNFNNPRGIVFDSQNNLFVASSNSAKIIEFSPKFGVIEFQNVGIPFALTVGPGDGIFYTDISTVPFAPTVRGLFNGDSFSALSIPLGLASDPVAQRLYVSDSDRNTITALNLRGLRSSVLIGSGLDRPSFLTVLGDNLYISDNGSGNILEFQLRTTPVPFEFKPTLGLGILGGLFTTNKLRKNLRKKSKK